MQTLIDFFGANGFMPHGYCLGWDSPLLWLTAVSDAIMTISYSTYPIGIAYFVWKRKDLNYRWLYLGFFITFILTCASTHFLSVVTIWIPLYWLEAYANAVAALVATATVFAIWWVIPRALKLPSLAQLQAEIKERQKVTDELAKTAIELNQHRQSLEKSIRELSIAKEAAETANIAKSTFISTMSHELRTPLNAILGFSELMSLDETATAKQKETLTIINRSGAHLLSMINDVLDISKIEAGRLVLDIQAIDLIGLLNDISVMINVRAATKQLAFLLDIAPDITQFIKTDSGKLRQVIINLLGNAIKFTPQGTVVLRAKTQSLASMVTTVLTIEVIDSGIGIPADKQAELFQPFIQLVQKKSDTEGTGLGLAISKSLIELMGGQISVSSVVGEGSIFRIDLPVELANVTDVAISENAKVVKHLAPNQPTWRLLIVDDNFENRLLLTTLLTDMGFHVREAENGQEAIQIFEDWQPHLIWMDMRMPVMNGYAATAKIRQLSGGDTVKIIALTANVFTEQHENIIKAGCVAVLHKPFHVSEIVAVLTKYLGVKFIYQEPVVTPSSVIKITAEMVAMLPVEMRLQLHEAALQLDVEEIEIVIAQIYIIAPEVAESLDELVKSFQFEQIIALVEAGE